MKISVRSMQKILPEFIYFMTLYHVFSEFLDDISEDVLPNEATGFKQSKIWSMLYDFKRDAVLAIINKLEKYNGCILGIVLVLVKPSLHWLS